MACLSDVSCVIAIFDLSRFFFAQQNRNTWSRPLGETLCLLWMEGETHTWSWPLRERWREPLRLWRPRCRLRRRPRRRELVNKTHSSLGLRLCNTQPTNKQGKGARRRKSAEVRHRVNVCSVCLQYICEWCESQACDQTKQRFFLSFPAAQVRERPTSRGSGNTLSVCGHGACHGQASTSTDPLLQSGIKMCVHPCQYRAALRAIRGQAEWQTIKHAVVTESLQQ